MARNINNKNKCLDYFCKNKLAKPKSKLCIESLEYLQEGIIKPCDDDHCPFYIDTKGPSYCPECKGDPQNRKLIG